MKTGVQKIVEKYGKDKTRLMDILIDVQLEFGCIPREITAQIADDLEMSEVDVEQTISFYHFFSERVLERFKAVYPKVYFQNLY